ncbi:DUF2975 domain-containing protein [Lentisphaera marina]|uniref:DUF2975 domain-containing protein n=1 Tax=Lentisphaera marina TaxID=1111041 RepID=UPI0023651B9C|nr:DUF2975 domain-containing protein [Lentisphaera marina]MDD7985226.1 DUF2975 domain-containing protein [Lentisphaera marina]
MQKMQSLSKWLKWIFAMYLIVLPVIQIVIWTYLDKQTVRTGATELLPYGVVLPPPITDVVETKFVCFLISMVPTAITMFVFYYLSRLFSLYSKGIIFEDSNVNLIKKIAYLLLIKAAIGPVFEAAITAAWTMGNPVGERVIMLTSQTINLNGIVTALIILVAAWVMNEGQKLKQEQLFTV